MSGALMMAAFLTACASWPNPDAVRDGTAPLRRAHAAALLTEDLADHRRTGAALLTALACAWDEIEGPC